MSASGTWTSGMYVLGVYTMTEQTMYCIDTLKQKREPTTL